MRQATLALVFGCMLLSACNPGSTESAPVSTDVTTKLGPSNIVTTQKAKIEPSGITRINPVYLKTGGDIERTNQSIQRHQKMLKKIRTQNKEVSS